ncbi:Uncharacterised protein [uncultured archaeon]|nr:Uncharacterised protein [uncultured archaeon]
MSLNVFKVRVDVLVAKHSQKSGATAAQARKLGTLFKHYADTVKKEKFDMQKPSSVMRAARNIQPAKDELQQYVRKEKLEDVVEKTAGRIEAASEKRGATRAVLGAAAALVVADGAHLVKLFSEFRTRFVTPGERLLVEISAAAMAVVAIAAAVTTKILNWRRNTKADVAFELNEVARKSRAEQPVIHNRGEP